MNIFTESDYLRMKSELEAEHGPMSKEDAQLLWEVMSSCEFFVLESEDNP